MKNYIIVEVEKLAIDLFITLLKDRMPKKYTILTQDILNSNRDLYIDKLYLFYQGKELQTIYENILEKYDINMKRLLNYAELRTNIDEYKKYLQSINI